MRMNARRACPLLAAAGLRARRRPFLAPIASAATGPAATGSVMLMAAPARHVRKHQGEGDRVTAPAEVPRWFSGGYGNLFLRGRSAASGCGGDRSLHVL